MSAEQGIAASAVRGRAADYAVAALIAALAFALYAPALSFGFVAIDDGIYVTDNALVQRGLSFAGVVSAFELGDELNWIPLTLISHMLDVSLFGLEPGGHHASSAILHAINADLVFLLLARGTGRRVRAALVAALFVVHPLQVESVAWVAERKNVLSTLLALLCIAAYAAYVRRPSALRYLAVCALLAAGLMAKPMLVTMPVLLLLVDHFPLARWPQRAGDRAGYWAQVRRLLYEKIPLLALALGCALLTMFAQHAGGAMGVANDLQLRQRLANAAIASLRYLFAMAWPVDLAIHYPHPYLPQTGGVAPHANELAAAVALLAAITFAVLRSRRGYLAAGWLWYLVALTPVIGIIQVGTQGWADRYAYVPLLGIFVMVVWGGAELLERIRTPRARAVLRGGALAVSAACLGLLAVRTQAQQQHWRDTLALYTNAVRVSPGHAYLRSLIAQELRRRGRLAEAAEHLEVAVRVEPTAVLYGELANVLLALGRPEQAIAHYRAGLARDPHALELRVNLANALVSRGELDEGIALLRQAAAEQPDSHLVLYNLANALVQAGRLPEATEHYRRVLAIAPHFTTAALRWAQALALQGDLDGAIRKLEAARAREPGHPQVEQALAHARALKQGTAAR